MVVEIECPGLMRDHQDGNEHNQRDGTHGAQGPSKPGQKARPIASRIEENRLMFHGDGAADRSGL